MKSENNHLETAFNDLVCPNIQTYWKLAQVRSSNEVILHSTEGNSQFRFSLAEGYALQHFIGEMTSVQIQNQCQQQFKDAIPANLVVELLQKLIALGILELPTDTPEISPATTNNSPLLKSCVQWIYHPEGYWILRNPEDVTFLQVSDRDRAVMERLGQLPPDIIAQEYNITTDHLRYLLQLLTATAMLSGTKPPKHPQGKLNPLQLLSFKFKLFNPDSWLTANVNKLGWIWTLPFCLILGFFLSFSAVVGINQSSDILLTGQRMWAYEGAGLMLPFALLMMLVVSIHELGHAFTLKHYGGIVPEIGLMFMCLMPGCYTNTTDAYCLVKRRQRTLVVAAGVLCQLIIWAVALWLWNLTAQSSWLHTASYLLMIAALFTVAINLNPLSKFDGYYLAVALSGINNLRSRSFGFYTQLLRGGCVRERKGESWMLAAYAPFSLAYTLFVFGHLLLFAGEWCLLNIPTLALLLLVLWAIYFYFPTNGTHSSTNH